MTQEWKAQLAREAATWELTLDETRLRRFSRYRDLLQEWNRRLNLTTVDDDEGIRVRHVLDSLSCATVTGDLNGQRLIDVGSGAGFPGLPLKILYPRLQLTLVESVTKKTRFLRAVVEELGLENVEIIDRRVETVGQDPAHREQYDWAVARAVAALPVLAEYLLPLCRRGGHALAMKGESAPQEMAQATEAISILGGAPPTLHPVQLPSRPDTYYLVLIEKTAPTPDNYPRRPGMPAKRPIGE
ncbi:MAG: 16S rRNA (guanine(527)-N(7))-methyltransferase RsmG [Chloroflexota bacterium]